MMLIFILLMTSRLVICFQHVERNTDYDTCTQLSPMVYNGSVKITAHSHQVCHFFEAMKSIKYFIAWRDWRLLPSQGSQTYINGEAKQPILGRVIIYFLFNYKGLLYRHSHIFFSPLTNLTFHALNIFIY